jgi:hypothetical protein
MLGISTDEAALEQVTDITLRSIQNSTRIAPMGLSRLMGAVSMVGGE